VREINYKFDFDTGSNWEYQLKFDELNSLISLKDSNPRDWTKLNFHKCSHCPLDLATHPHCPVAQNIDAIVEDSKDIISYTEVTVTVTSPERQYKKRCTVQQGLLSLFGLIMATSGCPHLDWLRPLARFHLPFASIEEALFRALSLQLTSEFFSNKRLGVEASKSELEQRYAKVSTLNHCFIERIRSYCSGDADKNAIAALDIWVQAFNIYQEDNFEPIKKFFE
jgi:hypothetical protein